MGLGIPSAPKIHYLRDSPAFKQKGALLAYIAIYTRLYANSWFLLG